MLEPWIIEQIRRREEEERRRHERPRMEIPMRDERGDEHDERWRNGDESESDEREKRDRDRAPERGVMIIDFGVS